MDESAGGDQKRERDLAMDATPVGALPRRRAQSGLLLALALAVCAPATAHEEKHYDEGLDALDTVRTMGLIKQIDGADLACDACLIEVDCTWPCELLCLLDLSVDYIEQQCPICLEYYGCEGCSLLCPRTDSHAPSTVPSPDPSSAPSTSPSFNPSHAPSGSPSLVPTPNPSYTPTPVPTESPAVRPSSAPTPGPTYTPTSSPTLPPSKLPVPSPTPVPSTGPTHQPSFAPTQVPSGAPSGGPTEVPSYAPTNSPSFAPSPHPTAAPEFLIYYTAGDYLYEYSMQLGSTTLLFKECFDGDLKVDNANRFLFWSCTSKGQLRYYDLVAEEYHTVLDSSEGVMGFDVDPSVGYIYYVDQAASTVAMVAYDGTNATALHTLDDKVPFGIKMVPAGGGGGDLTYTGMWLVSCYNDDGGYIVRGYLHGGDDNTDVVYTSTYTGIYGVNFDTETAMMYWIEDRGYANGIYTRRLEVDECADDDCEEQFVSMLSEAYWIAALWDSNMLVTADSSTGHVYTYMLDESGSVSEQLSIASTGTSDSPRCIGYFYGITSVFKPPTPSPTKG